MIRPRQKRVSWIVISVFLLAGAVLIHIRTFFFALCLIGILLICLLAKRQWSAVFRWVIAGGVSICLVAPWLCFLLSHEKANKLLFSLVEIPSINAGQVSLFWVPGTESLLLIASGGLSSFLQPHKSSNVFIGATAAWLSCCVAVVLQRYKKRHLLPSISLHPYTLLIGWCLVIIIILVLPLMGLQGIGFITIDSAIISFFVPLTLFAGGVFAGITGHLAPSFANQSVTITLLLIIGVWGASDMQRIINPATTFVTESDITAIHWIKDNLPENAKFASSVYLWQGATYAGNDGGYWIPVLTGRLSVLPPLIYTTVLSRNQAIEINQVLDRWSKTSSIDSPDVRKWLKQYNVTYLYLVMGKGQLQPQTLFGKNYVELVYYKDDVYIYHLK